MRNPMNTAESDGLLKGARVGVVGTTAAVILTKLTIVGGVVSGLVVVPAAAYGGYKLASWLRK